MRRDDLGDIKGVVKGKRSRGRFSTRYTDFISKRQKT